MNINDDTKQYPYYNSNNSIEYGSHIDTYIEDTNLVNTVIYEINYYKPGFILKSFYIISNNKKYIIKYTPRVKIHNKYQIVDQITILN